MTISNVVGVPLGWGFEKDTYIGMPTVPVELLLVELLLVELPLAEPPLAEVSVAEASVAEVSVAELAGAELAGAELAGAELAAAGAGIPTGCNAVNVMLSVESPKRAVAGTGTTEAGGAVAALPC